MYGGDEWQDYAVEVVEHVENEAFHHIKGHDDSESVVQDRIITFARDIGIACRMREGSVNRGLLRNPSQDEGRVERFLAKVLDRICSCSEEVTCIVESEHKDDVHLDLYASVYSGEFYETGRHSLRVSIFRGNLNEESYFMGKGLREDWDLTPDRNPESISLQDIFAGCMVFVPRCGGSIGRTLLDPRWISKCQLSVRLSDFDVTVRGKRLRVQAFPYRGQDGEVMSCGETTIMSLLCYYSNEYGDYPITMPQKVLGELARTSAERVTPSQGLSYEAVGRVLTSVGFHPRRYEIDGMDREQVPGDFTLPSERLRRVAWAYVSSGIPVAINVQPESNAVGHSLVLVGLEDDGYSQRDPMEFPEAERITGQSDDLSKALTVIDAADLERGRRFVVVDDSQLPYECRSWETLSAFRWMWPVELVVPTARGMALGAMDARDLAGEVFRSPKIGLSIGSNGALDGKKLVLTQQMVSVRSYLRQRVATCDSGLAYIWEESPFPKWAWLFECIEADQWRKNPWERRAVAELLLDATAVTPGDPTSRIVLLRYPGFLHVHGPNGDGIIDSDVPYDFISYDRNLRHVGAKADKARDELSANQQHHRLLKRRAVALLAGE